jgi:hypothetical protein
MMNRILHTISLGVLFTALVFISACEITYVSNVTTEQTLTVLEQSSQSTTMFKDIFNQVNNTMRYAEDSIKEVNEAKPVVKDPFPALSIEPFDSETWPKTITLDYGPVDHLCSDMRERRGKIIITATDFYSQPGSKLSIVFDNFYQDNYKIEGTQSIHFVEISKDSLPQFDVMVENGTIHAPDAKTYHYTQETHREWKEGSNTPLLYEDDVYEITGIQEGFSSDSIEYTLSIRDESPLNVWVKCRWIRAGVLDIDILSMDDDITLDYGEGECDNYATATFRGSEYLINME